MTYASLVLPLGIVAGLLAIGLAVLGMRAPRDKSHRITLLFAGLLAAALSAEWLLSALTHSSLSPFASFLIGVGTYSILLTLWESIKTKKVNK